MSKINLHVHSNHSLDGSLELNDIINEFNETSYISITDHDNCDTYKDLDLNKINHKGTLVYGIEADAIIGNITYDILCYGFELDNVSAWAKNQYGTIESRQMKIYNKLVETCEELNLELDKTTPYDTEKEFAHAAIYRMLYETKEGKSFLEKYNVSNVNDFYRLSTMDKNFPLYIDMKIVWPTIDELGKIIHDNGGKMFLAHPYKYAKGINVNEILDKCSKYVDGIEISNEPKDEEEVKYLYEYAKQNYLLVCAGSDYHNKEDNLNVEYLTEEMENDIINWINEIPGKIEF